MDRVLDNWLKAQHLKGMELAEQSSDKMNLIPLGEPPYSRYMVRYHAKGLVLSDDGKIEEFPEAMFMISFPDDYLREIDPNQFNYVTYRGPHARPWHPNILTPIEYPHMDPRPVCLHLMPATPLVEILQSVYDLWRYEKYATGDGGLNHGASQWVLGKPRSFPVDSRPMKRRTIEFTIELEAPPVEGQE